MQDRPNAAELVAAVRHFLEEEILPFQQDRRARFRTRVAANALAILQREIRAGSAPAREEAERLRTLLRTLSPLPPGTDAGDSQADADAGALRREIARWVRSGKADDPACHRAVFDTTLASVRAKLLISNPKLLEP